MSQAKAISDGGGARFAFGRNWVGFVRNNLSDERIEIARKHLLDFIKREDLKGLDFLDIGSGSGINSAAALKSQAGRILSFDYDPNSVAATRLVRDKLGQPARWQAMRGDVLDDAFMQSLGKWNFVYSWGVLHHTGEVWRAIENASRAVADGGLFYIALYAADVQADTDYWLRIKREYNQASPWKKRRMEASYIWNHLMGRRLSRLPRVLVLAARYRVSRGMSFFVNIRDWLGGWPMEFTYDADVVDFLRKRGFSLKNMATGEACSEFLFVRDSGQNS
jgi:2-polyprenyl-6-hydroxyphenyl methylase/3-demethylubiquinone-9 3-methyltransferase